MTATASRSSGRRIRRNRITTFEAAAVGLVAAATGVAATFAGAHPTAWRPADVVVTAAFAAFVGWAGASAPWWVLATGAAVAVLTASTPWSILAGVAFVLAIVIGALRLSVPVGRSAAAGLVILCLLNWDDDFAFGVSALVTAAVATAIAVAGVMRRRHLVRRSVYRILFGVAIAGGIAVLGSGIAMARAYGEIRDGERSLRDAAAALGDGDILSAVEQLERSEDLLESASTRLDRPWARPALAVPVVGQQVEVVGEFTRKTEALAATLKTTVAQINVESLQVRNGVVDINAIEILEPPLAETLVVLDDASTSLETVDSPWLLPFFQAGVDDVRREVDELRTFNERALTGVRLAPSMLGRDESRTYFIAFTTPAESRGLNGFMGTWAEMTADGGDLEVVRTGQTTELTSAMDAPTLDGPADYLARYGRFGAGENGAPVSVDFWSNVTMSPDFPSIMEVFAQLYPASGGREIDGAMAFDVETVARFLALTGPITVATSDGPLRIDASNAEGYLLRRQYAEINDDEARDAVLEELTSRLIQDVFGGTLPGPRLLGTKLGPALEEGRLVIASRDPEEQLRLDDLGFAGTLPPPVVDGLVVVSNNAGGNKLDAYLKRSVAYDAVVDVETGELSSVATVRLTNGAPEDLPEDAGGNPFDLPPGTNRMYLSLYSPFPLAAADLDGEPTGMEPSEELGWHVYSRFVEIAPGDELVLRLGFAGTVPTDVPYEFLLRSQALAFPDVVRVDVRTTDGEVLHSSHRVRVGVDRLIAEN